MTSNNTNRKLTRGELETYMEDNNIPIPTQGSGKNGRIIKKDLIVTIDKSKKGTQKQRKIPNLSDLPTDMYQIISDGLDTRSVLNLCETNKSFNEYICKNLFFWIGRLKKDFGVIYKGKNTQEASETYKKYLLEGESVIDAYKEYKKVVNDETLMAKIVKISPEEVDYYYQNKSIELPKNTQIAAEEKKIRDKDYNVTLGTKVIFKIQNELKRFVSLTLKINSEEFGLDGYGLLDYTFRMNLNFTVPENEIYSGIHNFGLDYVSNGPYERKQIDFPTTNQLLNPMFFKILERLTTQIVTSGNLIKFLRNFFIVKREFKNELINSKK